MSDRIEKEPEDCEVVKRLDRGGANAVKYDWKDHISIELQNGKGDFCNGLTFVVLYLLYEYSVWV